MFMFKKLKQIGNGIKNGISRTKENENTQDQLNDRLGEQRNQDLVTRKRKFELLQNPLTPEENEDKISEDPLLQLEEDDIDKDMKLKRLFKLRAKKLLERAESLTPSHYDEYFDPYGMSKEEEKEALQNLADQNEVLLNGKSKSLSLGLSEVEPKNAIIEEKKGDVTEKEKPQIRRCQSHQYKKSKSFSNKEELESSLKDFT